MSPVADVNLICVTDHWEATYSGMLPGVLAGDYSADQMTIDLVQLLSVAGVTWFNDELMSVDREQRQLLFRSGRRQSYDLLSVGIGSRPELPPQSVGPDGESIPVVGIKPMQDFLSRLDDAVRVAQQRQAGSAVLRIDIVGGGLGSVEVALCLPHFLNRMGLGAPDYRIRLISGASEPPVGCAASTRRRIQRAMDRAGIELIGGCHLSEVVGAELRLREGRAIDSDLVVFLGAGRAAAATGLFDLPKDDRGCLLTDATLTTLGDTRIWAGGDCGTIEGINLPKAGVYAVRQGPVMWDNLTRWARGEVLQPYQPQRDFLKLVNIGGERAIAEYRGWSWEGHWMWRWKDRIDTKFMRMYQTLAARMRGTEMRVSGPAGDIPESHATPMRCLGCGSKIAADSLRAVLKTLSETAEPPSGNKHAVGPSFELSHASDDVVLLPSLEPMAEPQQRSPLNRTDGAAPATRTEARWAMSVDAFPTPLPDPWLSGRLATIHALSDLWASGIEPRGALATVEIPFGSRRAQQEILYQLMAGISKELQLHRVDLLGGHSLEGPRLSIALTVMGLAAEGRVPAPKQGARPGDALVLTKGLGTGVALAAYMQGACPAGTYRAALESMMTDNAVALKFLQSCSVHAMTDVTGFGLLGHLHEMVGQNTVGSPACTIEIFADALRDAAFAGVAQLFQEGWKSTMHDNNLDFLDGAEGINPDSLEAALALDPQTSGGLLMAIPAEEVNRCVSLGQAIGVPVRVLGSVKERAEGDSAWCRLRSQP